MTTILRKYVGVIALVGLLAGPLSASAAVSQTNRNTGNNSRNTNRTTITRTVTRVLTKTASTVNSLVLAADTGGNVQERNTRSGDIRSGDVDFSVEITTEQNND